MSAKITLPFLLILSGSISFLHAQETPSITLRPSPNEVPILAVADVQPAVADKAGELSDALKTFNQVLWDDLSFSGFFTLAAKSFYPPQPIVHPETDLNYNDWQNLPFKVSFLTAGTLNLTDGARGIERL
jgi:hypothetical protein